MKLKIGETELKNNVFVAPMAGVTNKAFRKICHRFNPGIIYSEMVSDKALCYGNEKTLRMLDIDNGEDIIAMQVFGSEVDTMVKAAKIIEKECRCNILDINMGCPVKKVAERASAGAALLKDPEKVYKIVKAVVNAVNIPVTVKIRTGWDNTDINAVEVAKKIEEAGAQLITVHGRTRAQMYSGVANYDIIKEVKESVNIPVIANGDIFSGSKAKEVLEYTGCDGVMIGRGILGNPFLIEEIVCELSGVTYKQPSSKQIFEIIRLHLDYLIDLKSETIGIKEMRGHLAWYVKGLKGSKFFKRRINEIKTKEDFLSLIEEYENYLISKED